MPIQIRKSLLEEAELIAEFSRKTFHDSFAHQDSKENMDKFMAQFSAEFLAEEVRNPANTFLLALEDKGIVGYIKLNQPGLFPELVGENGMEIARIYVDKKMIGKGVGNLLMNGGLKLAKDLGIQVVWLGVWEHNINAISFYKKWGFERFSEHIFMLGDDPQTDWLMKKELV